MITLHPEVFHWGHFCLHWYGVMAALGLMLGYWTQVKRVKLYGFTRDNASDITFIGMVAAIMGARALYVLRFWNEQFSGNWGEIIKLWNGGLVFYGGFFGAAIALLIVCRIRHWAPWRVADLLAPALPLAHACGRIGCLINGCCFGFEYHGIGAIAYQYGPFPTFPLQGIAALGNVGIALFLLWSEKHNYFKKRLFLVYMILYCIGRFCIEFGRGDYPKEQLAFGGLTPAQVTCLWLLPGVVVLYLIVYQLVTKNNGNGNGK